MDDVIKYILCCFVHCLYICFRNPYFILENCFNISMLIVCDGYVIKN